jgi:DNA-binding transcriptional regulator YiaG
MDSGTMTAKEFKQIRDKLNLTQQELALALGLSSKNVISNIETGFRNPSGTVIAILKLLASLPQKDARSIVNKLRAQAHEKGAAFGN